VSTVHAVFSARISAEDLNLKGRILTPGIFTAHVDGEPARVRFTKPVIMDAYRRLQARLAQGAPGVEMRLVHPHLHPLSLPFGRVREVRADAERGDVWLTASTPNPEMESLLDDEARARLRALGLSIRAPIVLHPAPEGADYDYDAVEIQISAVDVVDEGAFDGSSITESVPAGLAARNAYPSSSAAHAGVVVHLAAQEPPTETKLMIENQEQVPEEVRSQLSEEQLAAYIEAYNAAIAAEQSPEEAHEAAMKVALEAKTIEGMDGDETDKDKEKDKEMTARIGKLQARAAKAETTLKTVSKERDTLRAELNATKGENKSLAERTVKLEEFKATLEAEKATREARDDVQWAIVEARRAAPAERATLLEARTAMGREKFRAMISARGYAIPVGEKGSATMESSDEETENVERAQRLVSTLGARGVLQSNVYQANGYVARELLARHGDDPAVKRLKATLDASAARVKTGGSA